MTDRYWVAAPAEDLASEMEAKIDDFYRFLDTTGIGRIYHDSQCYSYGQDPRDASYTAHALSFGGDQDELTRGFANHYRSLNEHVLQLTTANRPGMSCSPINSDSKSLAEARLGNDLLDYYMTERSLEDTAVKGLDYCMRLGEGWVHVRWDDDLGDLHDVDPLTNAPIYTGDLSATALRPEEVIRDPYAENLRELPWVIVRGKENRYDLAALYPGASEAILNAAEDQRHRNQRRIGSMRSEDFVTTWDLYVRPSPSMPVGRHCRMVGSEIVFDTALEYPWIPLIPVFADSFPGHAIGYTSSWNLLGLQEALNDVLTTALSNHDTFGLQNVWTGEGGLEIEDLGGQLRHFKSEEKPQAVQLTEISEHTYKLLSDIQQQMQTLRGLNDITRGNPSANASGAMGALMHAMASQYNGGFQRAYGQLLEELGTRAIRILQTFATIPRLIAIGGYRATPIAHQFTGDQIASVRRVKVEVSNALLRTTAGRQDIADKLLERGMITDPRQYLEVISTGRLEPVTAAHEAQRRGIEAENQLLMRGEVPQTLATDDHAYHVREHLALLAEPAIRADDEATALIMDHINTHHEVWLDVSLRNPGLLMSLGRDISPAVGLQGNSPTPSQVPNPGRDGAAPSMPANAGPMPGNTAPAPEVPGQAPAGMPAMPEDPRTGEPYTP